MTLPRATSLAAALTLHVGARHTVTGPADHPRVLGALAASLQALAASLEVRTPEARAARERFVLALGDALEASDRIPPTPTPKGK